MATTSATKKGQVVIPSKIRRKLNIKEGTKLYVEEDGECVILRPMTAEYFDKLAGILPTKGKLSKALLKEREADKQRER
ncbi:MAG: AbrB/MazE/SpoVT family DNA-binding domain-containing protein [Candidatus Aminicenantales bacterium]